MAEVVRRSAPFNAVHTPHARLLLETARERAGARAGAASRERGREVGVRAAPWLAPAGALAIDLRRRATPSTAAWQPARSAAAADARRSSRPVALQALNASTSAAGDLASALATADLTRARRGIRLGGDERRVEVGAEDVLRAERRASSRRSPPRAERAEAWASARTSCAAAARVVARGGGDPAAGIAAEARVWRSRPAAACP